MFTLRNGIRFFVSVFALAVVASLAFGLSPAWLAAGAASFKAVTPLGPQALARRLPSVAGWLAGRKVPPARHFFAASALPPGLGSYPPATVALGGSTAVTPSGAPTATTRLQVATNTNFKGTFAANPATGVVRVTNAHPAGTYVVTVTAFDNSGAAATQSFTLTVQPGLACSGTPIFTGTANVGVGSFPQSVAVGDFNGDGFQDFATNGGVNAVSIRLGDGAGNFTGTTSVGVGSAPFSVAIGDFNGDGKQDFATANYGSDSVSIRLGDGAGNFSGTTNVSVGLTPYSVAIGDFNGDGKLDFAAANYGSTTVSIRLGDGAGNFSGTTNVGVGSNPISVAIGDFNGDGKQDFATANDGSANVSIRLGDGAGNFSGTTNVSVGSRPKSVAIGDFNGDGKQDFAAANDGSANVSIRLGDGAGNFSGTTNLSVGTNPQSVAIGDFNGDGRQDFAAANYGSANVSIRLGDGAGNFSGTTNVGVGALPISVAIGDFNGDGRQDFAAANYNSSIVSIRLGGCDLPPALTPTGSTLTAGQTLSATAIAGATDARDTLNTLPITISSDGLTFSDTAATLNGVTVTLTDGNTGAPGTNPNATGNVLANVAATCTATNATFKLRVTDSSGNTDTKDFPVTVNPHNLGITLGASPAVTQGATSAGLPYTAVSGSPNQYSIDYDPAANTAGFVDVTNATLTLPASLLTLVVPGAAPVTTYNATLSVRNSATGCAGGSIPFTVTVTPLPTLGNYADAMVTLGGTTTVTPSGAPTATTRLQVATNTNFNGTFAADPATGVVRVTNAHPAGTYVVTVTAFNGTVSVRKTFMLTVQPGPACAATTIFTGTTEVGVSSGPQFVAIGDFNGDGKQDFAAADQFSDNVSIRLGDGMGGFSSMTNVSPGSRPHSVAIGDFDGDGKQDFAVANRVSNNVSIRLGDGMGGFSSKPDVSVGSFSIGGARPYSVAIGDFNGDGKQDFATANNNSNDVSIRLGDGAGNFSGTTNVSVGRAPTSVAIGDFNGDGFQDFAAANQGPNSVSIRLGDGAGNFSGTTEVGVGSFPASVAIGDFNGDGKQDFAAANQNSNTVSIRLGDGAGNFTGTTDVVVGTGPSSVAIGDFNGDGRQDFAAANESSNSVSIRLGDGAGNFSGTTNVGVGSRPRSVAIGDFNGDGRQDFAAANFSSGNVSIRLGGCDLPPGITPTGVMLTAGQTLSATTIAGATDARDALDTLPITISSDGLTFSDTAATLNGLTVTLTDSNTGATGTNPNAAGNVLANVAATCTATNATFKLRVTDSSGQTDTKDFPVTVNPHNLGITLGASPTVVQGTTSAGLPYTAVSGDANQYSINYDTAAESAGFVDVAATALPTSRLTLAVPGMAAAATYNATLTVLNGTTGCAGSSVPFTVTVLACPSQFTVNDLGDSADAQPGDTVCADALGKCTLRAAIQEANAITPCAPLTINFSVTGTITLTAGELGITHPNLTIQGPGAKLLSVSGNQHSRVLRIDSGAVAQVSGLTITGGNGVSSVGNNQFGTNGGGIYNLGTLTLLDCAVSGNSATSNGGGIRNEGGTLNVNGSLIAGNTATGAGGISQSGGTTRLSNSTISGNQAIDGPGGALTINGGSVTMSNVTVAGNTATFSVGGISVSGTLTFGNCFIAGNTLNGAPSDLGGAANSQGYNLIGALGSFTINGTTTGNQLGVNPLLGPLADNGGPTQTHALLPGSPALNAGNDALAVDFNNQPLTTDQRGFARQTGTVDIGAYESRGFTVTQSGNNQSTSPTTAFANPLALTISSAFGEPVQGGVITFTAPASGASAVLSGNPATVNANSQAGVTATANAATGSYPVTANVNGPASVTFNLSNTCPDITVGTPTATGALGVMYSSSVAATPSVSAPLNYRYSLANSTTLPGGLTLTANTGAITGTPTTPGNVSFDIRAELFNNGTTTGCAVTTQRGINITCVTNPVVTTNADSGAGSLRDAIAMACPGSTITFANGLGTITLTSSQLLINKNLTIQGPGAQQLTVSGNNASRVFNIGNGTPNLNVTLTGLTIANGRGTGTSFAEGGGVYNSLGELTMTNCTVSGNSTMGNFARGGGIYNNRGVLRLTNTTVSGNQAVANNLSRGGGIYNSSGTLIVTGSTVSGNSLNSPGGNSGGGIIQDGGQLTLTNSTIANNTVGGSTGQNLAGGLALSAGAVTIINSTISGNTAGGGSQTWGGGLNVRNSVMLKLINSTVSGNSATGGSQLNYGGGLYVEPGGTVTLTNSTISGNSVSGGAPVGGGVINFGTLRSGNSLIAGNTATTAPDFSGTLTSDGYNLIGNTEDTTISGTTTGNLLNTVALLAPLGNYGGPTRTHALLPGSPALNAGNNALALDADNQALTTDQRGFARQTGTVDIGAFEANYALAATGGTPQSALPNAAFAQSLTATLTESNQPVSGVPITFTVLPAGNGAGAMLSGPNPTDTNSAGQVAINATANAVAGVYQITAAASGLTPVSFNLANACPTITLAPLPQATAGVLFNTVLSAAPAGGNYQFSSANLPPWLSLTSNGTLSGTPPTVGTFNFTINVSGFGGACQQTLPVSLMVVCPTINFSPASLPAATLNTAYPTALSANPAGNYGFALTSGLLPQGLTLNANGSFSGAPTQSGNFNFRVTATGFSGGFGSCSAFQDYALPVTCPIISLAPANLPGGTLGTNYNQSVSATPAGSYSYSVSSGALPPGLMLNAATGAISGTPNTSGTFNFRIAASAGACSGGRDYSVTIACAGLTITTTSLPAGAAGAAYSQPIAVNPAASAGSYGFSLTQGNLPSGLTLHPTTGILSGTVTVTGNFSFTVRAAASNGCAATQSLTLAVNCPSVTLSALPTPTLNSPYNQIITASPSGGNYSFAVTAGALPAGLSLNAATGVISGTPTAGGAYNFTITASGFSGGFGSCTGSRQYTGSIAGGGCPTITLPDLPGGQPGQLYSQSLAAGPSDSYSYAVTSGSLPPGLTLFGGFGLVYGFPTQAGTFNFTITATNSANCTGAKSYSVQIGGAASRSLVFGDFDGDGKADLSVWRGASGEWLTVASSDGKLKTETWGTSAVPYFDVMTPGDYDGDGKMDMAVFRRATGEWFIKGSRDGAVTTKLWGLGTDVPVPGDYDGDGRTDIAVWRGTDTNWYIVRSSDGQVQTVSWGTSQAPYNDVPVAADFDGDGKTDIAVFRRQNGHWYIRQSSDGAVIDKAWGLGTDVPVAADYDGDGKADIAVWRGTDTNWYIVRSSDETVQTISWGTARLGDVPVPGDFDGDGKTDVAVWRASDGNWYAKLSQDGSVLTKAHGRMGDTPVSRKVQF